MLKNLDAAIAALKKHPHAQGIAWQDYDRLLTEYLMELAANHFCSAAVISAVADDDSLTQIKKRKRVRRRHKAYKSQSERQKDEARTLLRIAVRRGTLAKPNSCQKCLEQLPPYLIHGHHTDYSKPYDVEWLCPDCHAEAHNGGALPAKHEVVVRQDGAIVRIERHGIIPRPCDASEHAD